MKINDISDEQVNTILNLYKSGLGENKIQNHIGIDKYYIRKILRKYNITIIGTKRNFVNDDYFEQIDNDEKAYWLGFLYADGCVRIRREKYGILKLKLSSKDIQHIEKFKEHINSTNNIKTLDEYYNYKGNRLKTKSSYIEIYSTKMVNDLIKHGCIENKTNNINPPNLDDKYIRHFIRGFFDGDGCISIYNKINLDFYICCASELFINWLYDEFNKINISKQTIFKNNKGLFILRIRRINDLKIIFDYFYNNSNVYLDRKKKIFDNIKNKKKQ